MPLFPFD